MYFCLRKDKDDVCGQELWLDSEEFTSNDVIEQLKNFEISKEVVFCGYGEPLLKLDILKDVAKYIKDNYEDVRIRINTNGHANYVYKRNIVPELKGLVDEISVSLNGSTEEEYDELSQPKFKGAYDEVKNLSNVVLTPESKPILQLLTDTKADVWMLKNVKKSQNRSVLIWGFVNGLWTVTHNTGEFLCKYKLSQTIKQVLMELSMLAKT